MSAGRPATTASGARPRLGLVLGSGSARGWAHIGVLQELEAAGLRPDIVVGSSIGALVGGAYVAGGLDRLTDWALTFNRLDALRTLDLRIANCGRTTTRRSKASGRASPASPPISPVAWKWPSTRARSPTACWPRWPCRASSRR